MSDYYVLERTDGTRARFVHDEDHRPDYAYETDKLASGEWVALGCIIEKKCPTCGNWEQTDSLWGVVVNPSDDLETYALENMEWPDR